MQLHSGPGGVFCGLLRKCADRAQEPRKAKPEKKRPTGGSGIKMSDAEIDEARRAFECGEASCAELSLRYGVHHKYLWKVLAYELRTRSNAGGEATGAALCDRSHRP